MTFTLRTRTGQAIAAAVVFAGVTVLAQQTFVPLSPGQVFQYLNCVRTGGKPLSCCVQSGGEWNADTRTGPGFCDWGPDIGLSPDGSDNSQPPNRTPPKPNVPKANVPNPGQSQPGSPSGSGIG